MGIDHSVRIDRVAGFSAAHLAVLARRGPYHEVFEGDGADSTESLVVRVRDGEAVLAHRSSDRMAALWLDRAGVIWVAANDHLLRCPTDGEPVRLEVPARALTGLADGRVYCAAGDRVRAIAGARAIELPPLPDEVLALAGAGDALFAAGREFCCRWDGAAWQTLGEIDDDLEALDAVDADTLLAAGRSSQQAWRWRDGVWTLLTDDHPVADIAWWRGAVWIAADDEGLRRESEPWFTDALGDVHHVHGVVGGDDLIVASQYMVMTSADGEDGTERVTDTDIDELAAG